MPEERAQSSLFIWYHADANAEASLKQWLSDLFEKTGLSGQLFVRHAEGKTTFMETYENIGCEALETVEGFAAEQACFKSVQRRCEAFERVHTEERPHK